MLKRKINELITGKVGTNNGLNRDEWIENQLSNFKKVHRYLMQERVKESIKNFVSI